MSIIAIPEEIQEALSTIRNEAEDRTIRQLAGLKIGLWVLAEKDACIKAIEEEKNRFSKAVEGSEGTEESLAEVVKSISVVSEIQQRFEEADGIFTEVQGYMEKFKAESDSESEGETRTVLVNGVRTDITRVTKTNKNDGDKGIIPA